MMTTKKPKARGREASQPGLFATTQGARVDRDCFSTTFVIHSLRCDSHNVVTATLARTCAPRGFVQFRCLFLVSSSLSSAVIAVVAGGLSSYSPVELPDEVPEEVHPLKREHDVVVVHPERHLPLPILPSSPELE